jgi:hypothetical protein
LIFKPGAYDDEFHRLDAAIEHYARSLGVRRRRDLDHQRRRRGERRLPHREDPTPAHGFRKFDIYWLRILLVADGRRPYRPRPDHA